MICGGNSTMKPKVKTVLNKEQLRTIAKEFSLVLGGTMAEPRFKKKNSRTWVHFKQAQNQYKAGHWKYWAHGGIAATIASATKGGEYPHPNLVKSIGAKIGRLL